MTQYASAVFALVDDLRATFPRLDITVQQDHPQVDLNIDIPCQAGLPFSINLSLQEDELHLSVGGFWRSYHPCDRADVLHWFRETVGGLLSGSHRIVNHYRGQRLVAGDLEHLHAGEWKTVAEGYRRLWLGRRRTEILLRKPHRTPSNKPLERAGMNRRGEGNRGCAGRSAPIR
jgi:hypothetical protein